MYIDTFAWTIAPFGVTQKPKFYGVSNFANCQTHNMVELELGSLNEMFTPFLLSYMCSWSMDQRNPQN